jgi:conjugal transfer/type IV secretion protein DotA/TraY
MNRMFSKLNGLVALLWLITASGTALAQTSSHQSIASITSAANNGTDKSMSMLQLVFGSIVTNPLSSSSSSGGSAGGMISQVFLVLNSCILAVGVIWAIYHFCAAMIATGAEGEFLGAKKSSPWYVIRLGAGFAGLVPMLGGYSGAQAIMLWGTVMGVGIANLSLSAATSVLAAGGSMVATPTAPQVMTLAKSLFEANLCAQSANQALKDLPDQTTISADPGEAFNALPASGKIVLMNANGLSCGGAQINSNSSSSTTTASAATTDLAAYAPDTSSVSSSLASAQQSALTAMQSTLSSAAQTYVTAVDSGTHPTDPQTTINQAAQTYQASIQSAISSASGSISSLSSTVQSNLTRDGWMMLGAWYQTFAMANSNLSAMAASVATAVAPTDPSNQPYPQLYRSVMAAYNQQIVQGASTSVPTSGATSGSTATAVSNLFSESADPQGVLGGIFNGQQLVNNVISTTSASGQSASTGASTINPLIGMKNLGDEILDAGWLALAGYAAVKGFEGATDSTLGKVVSTVLDLGTGGLTGAVTGAMKGVIQAIGPLILLIVITLFFFGATLSVYLPMLPFIVWFSGIVSWFAVVAEAVVASPLWAFAHLDGDGEGMGQRTTHGYIFLLNVMFRPIFMVLGFLLAGAGIVVLGTLLNTMFGVAMQNAQYNSTTGIVSIIGFIVLYVGMCQTLCNSLFNLIHIIPDQAFSWLGGQMEARAGRDLNDKSKEHFGAGVRHGSQAASSIPQAIGRPRDPSSAASAVPSPPDVDF